MILFDSSGLLPTGIIGLVLVNLTTKENVLLSSIEEACFWKS